MAETLFRLLVEHADRSHDLRAARHPSESNHYFVARLLAFVFHYEPGLTFSRGVCIGKEPALFTPADAGRSALWIDVGRPGRKKLIRGLAKAEKVIVYGYGDREPFRKTLNNRGAERLQVFWLSTGFLDRVASTVTTGTTRWQLSLEGNTITVNGICGERSRLLL